MPSAYHPQRHWGYVAPYVDQLVLQPGSNLLKKKLTLYIQPQHELDLCFDRLGDCEFVREADHNLVRCRVFLGRVVWRLLRHWDCSGSCIRISTLLFNLALGRVVRFVAAHSIEFVFLGGVHDDQV